MSSNISILGAGSWGIANACLLTENGHAVTMWEFDPAELKRLLTERQHTQKLPGILIPESIKITGELSEAVADAEIIVFAVPTQKIAGVCQELSSVPGRPDLIVNLSKGIEEKTLRRVSQIIGEEWTGIDRQNIVTLSGPSHAEEVTRKLPTSVVAAGNDVTSRRTQKIYSSEYLRVYRSADLIGVELGGALKNIIAIAAGIVHGLGHGDNTMGALITRGLFEINRLAVTLGAQPDTLAGLSGVGDLITTCISRHSRNHYVGYHIGQGMTLEQVLSGMVMVAEGVTTCRSARQLARQNDVDMPITEAVYQVLFNNVPVREAVNALMTRPLKAEVWQE